MKEFGLQIFSIRDHFTTEEDTRESFKRMKEYGYTQAQTAGTYSYIAPEKFRALADEYGIKIIGTHYNWDLICNDVEGTVKYHNILGTKLIGIGGMPAENRASVAGVEAFIAKFNEMAAIYAKDGFVLTYHNHDFEFKKLEDGKTVYDHLMAGLDPVNCKFVLDAYWAHSAGIDVRDLIERLSGRIAMIHLKDCEAAITYELADGKTTRGPRRIEVGEGNMNFKGIIKTAEDNGCHLFVVEDEVYSTGESYDSVRISAANIIKKFLEK